MIMVAKMCRFIAYACVGLLVCAPVRAQGEPTSDFALTLAADHATAMLKYVTILTGEQLGELAAGHTVALDSMTDSARSEILDAFDLSCGIVYTQWRDSLPPEAHMVTSVIPRVKITLLAEQFGAAHEETIDINEIVKPLSIRGTVDRKLNPDSHPGLATPATLGSILAQAPADPGPRAAWLKARAQEALLPIADIRLKLSGVAFTARDFSEGRTLALSALSGEQSIWLKQVYSDYCVDVAARQALLQRAKERTGLAPTHAIVDASTGIAADPKATPSYALPLWSEISPNAEVRLSMSVMPMLTTEQRAKGGVGMSLD